MGLDRNIEERLRWLDDKFRSGGAYTKQELLDGIRLSVMHVKIAKRTLEYDLERLKKRVIIRDKYTAEGKRYYYDDPKTSYFAVHEQEGIVVLERLVDMVSQMKGIGYFSDLSHNIMELSTRFHINVESPAISFDSNNVLCGLRHLDKLYWAIRKKQVLEIKSESFNRPEEEKYRPLQVHPYHLKEYANRWYLIGYTKEHGACTCLPVDRMRSIVVSDAVEFRPMENQVDYASLFNDRIGVGEGKPIELILRLHPVRYRYFVSKKFHSSQELLSVDDDGWCRVRYQLKENEELRQKLLSYGSELEVVAPADLRLLLLNRMKRMLKLYSK